MNLKKGDCDICDEPDTWIKSGWSTRNRKHCISCDNKGKSAERGKKKREGKVECRGEQVDNHVKVYCDSRNIAPSDRFHLPCEFPDCQRTITDIHHIYARGMGGDPNHKKDKIEWLMGCCHPDHMICEAEKLTKEQQLEIHANAMASPPRS